MFTSSTSVTATGSPLLPHDQTGNPNSSSSSFYYPYPSNEDQMYQFDFDDILDDDYLSLIDPPNYQNPNYLNFGSYMSISEQTPVVTTAAVASTESSDGSMNATYTIPPNNFYIDEYRRERLNAGSRIAFRMKTELEIVDDGYRWRKYGKKKVKSSPNPRNYYRCSTVGCNVKKRVERDKDDPSYVITAYEGVHNHESPSMTLGSTMHRTREWTFQPSS